MIMYRGHVPTGPRSAKPILWLSRLASHIFVQVLFCTLSVDFI